MGVGDLVLRVHLGLADEVNSTARVVKSGLHGGMVVQRLGEDKQAGTTCPLLGTAIGLRNAIDEPNWDSYVEHEGFVARWVAHNGFSIVAHPKLHPT